MVDTQRSGTRQPSRSAPDRFTPDRSAQDRSAQDPSTRDRSAQDRSLSARPPAYDRPQPDSLADLLERVLDKGVVLAGDIRVNLLDIELLTIKIRLLLVSVDKAAEMGIDWWRRDPMLSSEAADNQQALQEENARLRERLDVLESRQSEHDQLTVADHDQQDGDQQARDQQDGDQQGHDQQGHLQAGDDWSRDR